MSDFNLARQSCEEVVDFDVIISEADNGAEERRLKNTNSVLGFKIKTPFLTKTQMQAYRSFIVGKYGSLSDFTFTSPFDDTEYSVRFVPNSFISTYEAGCYQCAFEFKRC